MKKSLLIILSLLVFTMVFANTDKAKVASPTNAGLSRSSSATIERDALLSEGFEGETIPADWTILNLDGDVKEWDVYETSSAYEGAQVAKVGYNGDGNNDWLITPQLTVTGQEVFEFFAKSASTSFLEDYNVLISTSGNAPEDFTLLDSVTGAPNEWMQKQYSLADYSGDIYLAIQCVSVNELSLYIDALSVAEPSSEPIADLNINQVAFGEVIVGNSGNTGDVITLTNTGGGTLDIISATDLAGTGFSSNLDVEITLAAGESFDFGIEFTPTDNMEYNTIYEIETNGGTLEITVSGNGYILANNVAQIGSGLVLNSSLPLDPYYNYGFNQSLYLAEELANTGNLIENIAYNFANDSEITVDIVVYLSHTTETVLNEWETEATEVFADTLQIQGEGWVNIPLTTPFEWNGTDNLVVTVENNTGDWFSSSDDFYATDNAENFSIYQNSDSNDNSFDDLPEITNDSSGGNNSTLRPNVRFTFAAPELPAVFFSEYIEGSSNNKALEIYNASDVTVDLTQFAFPNTTNDPDVPGDYDYWNSFAEGSTLAPGEVYVIGHPEADAAIADVTDQEYQYLSNGDDGFALVYGTEDDYVIIDRIGDWQADPGAGWDVAGITEATKDHTLIRKDEVTAGNTDWTASAGTDTDDSEWIVLEQDTFENLGWHINNPDLNGTISGIVTLAVEGDVTAATVSAGDITVNPAADGSYSLEIAPGTYDVTASLSGFTTVTVSDVVVEESGTTENIDFTLEESLEMPQPVDVTVDAVTGTMSWFPPAGEGSEGWIGWSAEENNDGIGMTGGGTFSVASRWDTENIAPYHGMTLSKISFFPNEATGRTSFVVKVWTGDNAENLVAEQDVTPVMGQWNEVELDNPVSINAYEDLWFGYTVVDHADGEFPAGTDAGPAVAGYGDMISMDGSAWSPLSEQSADLNYNWNIKGFVDAPSSRTIPMTFVENDFDNVTVRDASALVQGNLNPTNRTTREVLGYNVYLDGELVAENISELSYTFDELEVDAEYTGAVEAIFADAVSEPVEVSFTFAGTLDIPTNLAVDATTGMVTWGEPGAGGASGTILEEGFEGESLPTGWTTIDNDGDGFNWEIVPEGNATHTGSGAAWSTSFDNASSTPLTPDNYLITPQLDLDASSELSFWVIAQDQDWADEQYFVKVSTSGTDVADFETVFEEVVGAGDWRQVTVDLSAYAGESVYIAFNHAEVTDMFAMNIDDVTVTGADSRDFTGAYNVYKNGVLVGENITEQNFQLTALLEFSDYTIGVTALHDAGESAAAETTFFFLGEEQILPVDDLAVDENSGELSWSEPAPAIDYSDDFDAYTAGDYLAEVSDMWTTWAQNPGGSDDAMISDAVANSGTNSVHIEGTSDLVLPLGNKTSGTYEFSMMMYLEPGNGGYYNIQHYQTPGEEWGAEFYFGDDGNGEYSAGYPEAQPFTHPTGEWFEVKNVIDLDAAEGTFLVDGTEVASWDFGLTAQGEPGINQLGGINIYSGAISGQTPNFYFDDVSIFKVTDRPVLSYDVYLDDTLVGNTTETTYMLEELTNGEEYTAGVVAIFESGDSEMTEITFTYSGTFSEGDLVLTTALNGNYPNPFNPTTTISFSLAETANVDLKVYNAKGQVVKTLVAGEMNADNHTVVWNGDDNNGKSVSSGVYFYRMSTKGFSSTHKMMLIK